MFCFSCIISSIVIKALFMSAYCFLTTDSCFIIFYYISFNFCHYCFIYPVFIAFIILLLTVFVEILFFFLFFVSIVIIVVVVVVVVAAVL